jgi:hypothetical protein
VREWSNTISYMKQEVHQDWLLSEGQRFEIEYKKNETTRRCGMKQKEENSPISKCGCCTWAQQCE